MSISPTHCQFTNIWGTVNTPNFPNSCPCRQPLPLTINTKDVRNPDNFSWLEGSLQFPVAETSWFTKPKLLLWKKKWGLSVSVKEKIIWAVTSAYTFLHNDHWIFRPLILPMHPSITFWKPVWAALWVPVSLCCGNSWGECAYTHRVQFVRGKATLGFHPFLK